MPKASPIQSDFSGGEVSPLLHGRVDSERYKQSLKTCLNYIPLLQGPATRRPGTMFVAPTKDGGIARLQPFEFNTTQAYMIEFGNNYIRWHSENSPVTFAAKVITGITQATPAVVTAVAHGFSNGDRVIIEGVVGMTETDNVEYEVANVATDTFELKYLGSNVNSTGYGAYVSGGTASKVLEVVSTYTAAQVFDLKFTQSADILYIVHPLHPPAKLSRTSNTSWTLADIVFLDGPYLSNPNVPGVTMTPAATTGTGIGITASVATFVATDVGRLIRIKEGSTWGYALIKTFSSTTAVTVDIKSDFGSTSASTSWQLGVYSTTTGFPSCVTFHEDRLCFAGAKNSPQRVDCSNTGDYENFAPTAIDGTVKDSNGLGFSFNSSDVNSTEWIVSDEKGLLAGTHSGEWLTSAAANGTALSPTNILAKKSTSYGSENVQPVQAGKNTVFVQLSGRKLRELNFDFYVDGFRAQDVTQLAEHISPVGIVQMAFQKEPQGIVWCVRNDGVLVGMTYDRDPQTLRVAWHRHIFGGASDSAGSIAEVESCAVIPSSDGLRQDLWLVIKRKINGHVMRHIEYVTKLFEADDLQRDAFFVDDGLSYDAPLTITAITNANPGVVTSTTHGLSNGDKILITGVLGMANVNSETFLVASSTTDTFALHDLSGNNVNTTAFGSYVSGGSVRKLITNITGLNHLEGQTVQILADGSVRPSQVVSHGKIVLTDPAATVQVGLGYNSDLETLRLEAGSQDGTALGKTRRIHRLGILFYQSLGIAIGPDFDNLDTIVFRKTSDPMTRAPSLFSGIVSESLEFGYDFENNICLRQSQPLPSTILAIMPQLVTQDRG